MDHIIAKFPDSVWDGTTPERPSIFTNRSPDQLDWAYSTAEIIAIENHLINNSNLVSKGFVLGASAPVTTGTNKLPPFTVPGNTSATLLRIRINAAVSGTISIRFNINSAPVLTLGIGDHENINLVCASGEIVTIDVVSADGTIQGVTSEMEFSV